MIAIGKTQESFDELLTQLNKQLASINESISNQLHSQNHCSESREGFNKKLQMQV